MFHAIFGHPDILFAKSGNHSIRVNKKTYYSYFIDEEMKHKELSNLFMVTELEW
jgi:hypothetical protein